MIWIIEGSLRSQNETTVGLTVKILTMCRISILGSSVAY
jgi:hypothetical protein